MQRGLLSFEGSWTSTAVVVLSACALLNNSSFSTELFLHLWLWVLFVPPESAWLIGINPLPARPEVARRAWAPCCCSVTQSCPTLCNHKERTPAFPVLHFLPVFAQTHVLWVDDTIQPSCPLSSSSPLFQWGGFSHQVAKVLELQPQHQSFWWLKGFLGHKTFSANTGTVLGKPGLWSPYMKPKHYSICVKVL